MSGIHNLFVLKVVNAEELVTEYPLLIPAVLNSIFNSFVPALVSSASYEILTTLLVYP
jgi:hypothetical protein